MLSNEFLWYCPDKQCHLVLFKTHEPILIGIGVHLCKRCGVIWKRGDIEKMNLHNLRKYIKIINDVIVSGN